MAQHINEQELSDRLRLSVRTLQRWRWRNLGPPYLKLGRRVVYTLADIEAWEAESRKTSSTNESNEAS